MNLDIRKLILLVENIKIYYICFFIYNFSYLILHIIEKNIIIIYLIEFIIFKKRY